MRNVLRRSHACALILFSHNFQYISLRRITVPFLCLAASRNEGNCLGRRGNDVLCAVLAKHINEIDSARRTDHGDQTAFLLSSK